MTRVLVRVLFLTHSFLCAYGLRSCRAAIITFHRLSHIVRFTLVHSRVVLQNQMSQHKEEAGDASTGNGGGLGDDFQEFQSAAPASYTPLAYGLPCFMSIDRRPSFKMDTQVFLLALSPCIRSPCLLNICASSTLFLYAFSGFSDASLQRQWHCSG